jgi:hypothetical protein
MPAEPRSRVLEAPLRRGTTVLEGLTSRHDGLQVDALVEPGVLRPGMPTFHALAFLRGPGRAAHDSADALAARYGAKAHVEPGDDGAWMVFDIPRERVADPLHGALLAFIGAGPTWMRFEGGRAVLRTAIEHSTAVRKALRLASLRMKLHEVVPSPAQQGVWDRLRMQAMASGVPSLAAVPL